MNYSRLNELFQVNFLPQTASTASSITSSNVLTSNVPSKLHHGFLMVAFSCQFY